MTLSVPTTTGQSKCGSNGNEGVLHILKAPRLRFMSYPGHSMWEVSYPSVFSVFYRPADQAVIVGDGVRLPVTRTVFDTNNIYFLFYQLRVHRKYFQDSTAFFILCNTPYN